MKGAGMDEGGFRADFERARRMHQALWAAGDYARVAQQLTDVSAAVVKAAGCGPGNKVLDLGAGAGNTAILAAGRGAEGLAGHVARMIASYLPPAPPDAPSPWVRASEESVRATLGPAWHGLTFARHMASSSHGSPESYIGYLEEVHGRSSWRCE